MRAGEKITSQTFADNEQWFALAKELEKSTGATELTPQMLAVEAKKVEGSDPDRKDMLHAMLRSLNASKQQQPPPGVFKSQQDLRAASGAEAVPTTKKLDEETARFRAFLDTRIVEQNDAKDVAARFYKASNSKLKLQKKPLVKLFAGPPGVGKTLMSKAEAEAVHGNKDAMIFIDCARLTDITALGKIIGIGRGYVGSDQECLFSPENIQRTFGAKRPVIIHIDEPDKMPADVAAKFWNVFNNFFQSGRLEMDPNTVDFGGQCIVNIAVNSGHDKAKNLNDPEARRSEYRAAASAALAAHTDSRIDFVCAFDPLSREARKKIAKFEIESLFRTAMEESAKLGKVVRIEPPSAELCDLVARLAANDDYGARPVASFVSQVLNGLVDDVIGEANDEETFEVRMSAPIEGPELARIEKDFKENKGRLPPGYDASHFNIQMLLKNPPPRLLDYPGQIPVNEFGEELRMFGSGVVAGRCFFMYNKMDYTSPNELMVIQPGVTEAEDTFAAVKLPPELETAHFVYATPIDEKQGDKGEDSKINRVMFVGVTIPSDETSKKPQLSAFVWEPARVQRDDEETAPDPWKKVKAPPFALGDASFGSVDGKVLLWGGRRIMRDPVDHTWTTQAGTKGSVGKDIEKQGYVFDVEANDWNITANVPRTGRTRAAIVRYEDTLRIIGGEQTASNPQGVAFSKASADVDVWDPKSGAFSEGTDLREGIAFAGVYRDDFSRIRLIGGADLLDNGYAVYPRGDILSLDPRLERPAWKERGNFGMVGRDLVAIPHPKGGVVIGPFYDKGDIRWKLEKAPETVIKG